MFGFFQCRSVASIHLHNFCYNVYRLLLFTQKSVLGTIYTITALLVQASFLGTFIYSGAQKKSKQKKLLIVANKSEESIESDKTYSK